MMDMHTISHVAQDSGGIIYIMMVLLLVSMTIAIERSWYLWRAFALGKKVMDQLEAAQLIEHRELVHFGESFPDLPHVKVLSAALQHDLDHDFERISDKLEESIMREAPGVDRHLWVLDTIVTMAPLLGLLGTIIGMFNAFQVLGDPGTAPTKVTGGVAEALLATASGLFIAILGLFFFNALSNRVRVIMHQLETLKVMLVNRMYPHYQGGEGRGVVSELRTRTA